MSVPADVTGLFYPVSDDALVGYGMELQVRVGTTSPATYESIAGVSKITPGQVKNADVRTTHLRSPDRHHEHKAGMGDSDPFAVELVWLLDHPSQSNAGGGTGAFADGGLCAMAADGLNRDFRIRVTTASPAKVWPFNGYIAGFQPGEITVDDVPVTATCQIQPSRRYTSQLP